MNPQMQSHLFWGKTSPLSSLSGAALLVIASVRISSALLCGLALVFVYVFVMAAAKLGGEYFPVWGRSVVLLFLSSLAAGIFQLILGLVSPVLALESAFFVFFVPVTFIASGLCGRVIEYDLGEVLSESLSEALILGGLIVGLSLIREPLGFGSVSFPGLDIIRFIKNEQPVKIELLRFLQTSAGAFILLGYGYAIFRHYRNQITNSEDD